MDFDARDKAESAARKPDLHDENLPRESAVPASVVSLQLSALPPYINDIFAHLKNSGAKHFTLYGGAMRDVDLGSRSATPKSPKDYDLRIWFPPETIEADTQRFLARMAACIDAPWNTIPAEGTPYQRHIGQYRGIELDVSIRAIPQSLHGTVLTPFAVAHDRILDSDASLSAIALDPEMNAWARPEYLSDRDNGIITLFFSGDDARQASYAARMRQKYPERKILTVIDERKGLPWLLGGTAQTILTDWTPPLELVTSVFGLCFKGRDLLMINHEKRGWDVPGGHVEGRESLEETLQREVLEEADARIGRAAQLGVVKITMPGARPPDYRYPFPVSYMVACHAQVAELLPFAGRFETTDRALLTPNDALRTGWVERHRRLYEAALALHA